MFQNCQTKNKSFLLVLPWKKSVKFDKNARGEIAQQQRLRDVDAEIEELFLEPPQSGSDSDVELFVDENEEEDGESSDEETPVKNAAEMPRGAVQ